MNIKQTVESFSSKRMRSETTNMITLKLDTHEAWVLTEVLSQVLDNDVLDDSDLNDVVGKLYERVLEERSK